MGHGQFDLNSRVDLDAGDLLNVRVGAHEVDHALINSQLESLVSVGAVTTRRFSHCDLEVLYWHSHRALHAHVAFSLRTLHYLGTH